MYRPKRRDKGETLMGVLKDGKDTKRAIDDLNEATGEIVEFHERLQLFLLALKGLNNSDVDRVFSEHEVKIIVDGDSNEGT